MLGTSTKLPITIIVPSKSNDVSIGEVVFVPDIITELGPRYIKVGILESGQVADGFLSGILVSIVGKEDCK